MPGSWQSETIAQLPVRVRPMADESLIGYLMRAASENLLSGPPHLLKLARVRMASLEAIATRRRNLGKLAAFCGTDAHSLVRISYRPSCRRGNVNLPGFDLRREYVSVHRRRFCPQCLREAPYHRAIWDLSVASVCVRHRAYLHSQCPECESRLSWRSGSVDACKCGHVLSATKPKRASHQEVMGMAAILASLGHPDANLELEDPLRWVDPCSTISLLLTLGWFSTGHRRRPRSIKYALTAALSSQVFSDGFRICEWWSAYFYDFLDQL